MRTRSDAEAATVNLTPMIDVVFLLVIFFMVGSKFSEAESRIQVNVPMAGQMRSLGRVPDERIVAIAADGSITLDDIVLTTDQLTDQIRSEQAAYPALRVAVRADRDLNAQRMVEVMHAVRVAGVTQIGIATRRMQR